MRKSVLLTGLLLAVMVPSALLAQDQVGVAYVGNYGWNYSGYYVGPYRGVVPNPGGPTIDMYCVDAAHEVTSPWTAWVTPLTDPAGDMSHTYLGDAGWDAYWKAAYLTTKFYDPANASNMQIAAIHAAIWSITGGLSTLSGFTPPTSTTDPTSNYNNWVTDANANYMAFRNANVDQYALLTDVKGQSQEFLVKRSSVVPEPGTWLMLLTGLIGVAGIAVLKGARV